MTLVSMIMPAYNTAPYIGDAIKSVLNQRHENWELIIVDDGSTDNTVEIARGYGDSRIRLIITEHRGVSAARNVALYEMQGDYFCFIDSDDILPAGSLSSRLQIFASQPDSTFVDGRVVTYDDTMTIVQTEWQPRLSGNPLHDLIRLDGRSFFGMTWMVKREAGRQYRFHENLSHGEDLLFYLELAREGGIYNFTDELIFKYRNRENSAMKDLSALNEGYRRIRQELMQWPEVPRACLRTYTIRYKRAMMLAHLNKGEVRRAISVLRA